MGGVDSSHIFDPATLRLLLSEGIPSALLCIITLWFINKALPALAAAIERISLRHGALLERQSELLTLQGNQLHEVIALLERQTQLLEGIERGLASSPAQPFNCGRPAADQPALRRRRSGS